jgi:hypothetical protein
MSLKMEYRAIPTKPSFHHAKRRDTVHHVQLFELQEGNEPCTNRGSRHRDQPCSLSKPLLHPLWHDVCSIALK